MTDYKNIYERCFNDKNYNVHDNTEFRYQEVINFLDRNDFNSLIDIGSGRGQLISIISENNYKLKITSCDITKFHSLDIPFIELNLCEEDSLDKLRDKRFELLTCLDVLEHLEKNCTHNVIKFFSEISDYCILSIANHSDIQHGVELHLTQENSDYWSVLIENFFDILDMKTLYDNKLYVF